MRPPLVKAHAINDAMVSLTERARDALAAHTRASGADRYGLKIFVVAGGCSGFSYDLHFVEAPAEGDLRFGDDGLPVYVDPVSLRFLEGTEIDYDRGFHFKNPNARNLCACGSSFEL